MGLPDKENWHGCSACAIFPDSKAATASLLQNRLHCLQSVVRFRSPDKYRHAKDVDILYIGLRAYLSYILCADKETISFYCTSS